MLFTSGWFFAFLGLIFVVYYTVSGAWQLRWLICASLFFYSCDTPGLVTLLLLVAIIDVVVSRKILVASRPKAWAVGGVAFNLGVLAFFKYNHLLATTLPGLDGSRNGPLRMLLELPLPIGISFYTLHGISLLLDTLRDGPSRRDVSQARTFSDHAHNTLLYMAFFPQLIAGPIVKAHFFYPQIRRKQFLEIDWDGAISSLVVGYFLKCVIADNLSEQTFWMAYPYFLSFSTIDLIVFLFGYSFQIFADFAGYSLIAIGLAKLFGYNLPANFAFPYISESFSEFWTRWHISLSSWIRDYLYIPLGGNRKGRIRTYINLMTVMAIGGMWHGAAWSYGVWGLWHGSALAIERLLNGHHIDIRRDVFRRILRGGLVFIVVSAGWLLFKMPHFSDVLSYLRALTANRHVASARLLDTAILLYSLPIIAYHMNYLIDRRRGQMGEKLFLYGWRKHVALGALAASIVLNAGPSKTFIYFQF
jgi:alginate O-acetyltransferase complex protein AlgI